MFTLSICIDMIFKDLPFLQRIEKTAEAGYKAFEFWGWEEKDLAAIKKAKAENQLKLVAITGCNTPLTDPEKQGAAVSYIEKSIQKAHDLNCPNVIITVGQEQPDLSRREQKDSIIKVLTRVAPTAEKAGVMLVVEPLNTAVNHQGYFLATSYEGYEIINEVNSQNVKLLFDIYHQQITEGNIIANITEHIDLIGHFHLADVPGRHEPGTGELNYANIFTAIKDTGYDRYVGCEFKPVGDALKAVKNVLALQL